MPEPLSSRQRALLTDDELRDEYSKAYDNLRAALASRPTFERESLSAWFDEVAACWDCLWALQKEFERRWEPVTTATPEEAEKVWRYWKGRAKR